MKTEQTESANVIDDRQRLMVENYKKHFRAMKARLKAYTDHQNADHIENKENEQICPSIHADFKKTSLTIDQTLLPIDGQLQAHKIPRPAGGRARLDDSKHEKSGDSKNIVIRNEVITTACRDEALAKPRLTFENTAEVSKSSSIKVVQREVDTKHENQLQFPLLSFRAPLQIKESEDGPAGTLADASKKAPPSPNHFESVSHVLGPKNQNMLTKISISPIQSPMIHKTNNHHGKAKKRILINLSSPSSHLATLQSQNNSPKADKYESFNRHHSSKNEDLNFDQKLEEIKQKAMQDDYFREATEPAAIEKSSQAFSKHFFMRNGGKTEENGSIMSPKAAEPNEKKFIQVGQSGYSLMGRSKSFFRGRVGTDHHSLSMRNKSERKIMTSNDVWNKLSKRRSRGMATCQSSVDSSKTQETPSFHKLSLSQRKTTISTFTNSFLNLPAHNCNKESLVLTTSRRESIDQRSISGHKFKKPRRLDDRSASNSRNKRATPLALDHKKPPKVAIVELMGRLAKGERALIDKKEMIQLTKKNYSRLPEVVEREKSKQAAASVKEKLQRVKEYDLVGVFNLDDQESIEAIDCL